MKIKKNKINSLLIEIFTEELPNKNLKNISFIFSNSFINFFKKKDILNTFSILNIFVTTRRISINISKVLSKSFRKIFYKNLITIDIFNNKFAKKKLIKKYLMIDCKLSSIKKITKLVYKKNQYLIIYGIKNDLYLLNVLKNALNISISNLSIYRFMKYHISSKNKIVNFIRPVNKLIILLGNDIIPLKILKIISNRYTIGHRFLSKKLIIIDNSNNYQFILINIANVVVSFYKRKKIIIKNLEKLCIQKNKRLFFNISINNLILHSNSLIELPGLFLNNFNNIFLNLPLEFLIIIINCKQKSFYLLNTEKNVIDSNFLVINNLNTNTSCNIIGNKYIIHSNLKDVKLFYESDKKKLLISYIKNFSYKIYQSGLGSQLEKIDRIILLSYKISNQLNISFKSIFRTVVLSKADLNTYLVESLNELQGLIGSYYANINGEIENLSSALMNQYCIKLNKIIKKKHLSIAILFISTRIELIFGLYFINKPSSGEKDPYGIRRASLGIISIFEKINSKNLFSIRFNKFLELMKLINCSNFIFNLLNLDNYEILEKIKIFIYEKFLNKFLRNIYIDKLLIDFNYSFNNIFNIILDFKEFLYISFFNIIFINIKRIKNIIKKIEKINKNFSINIFENSAEIEMNNIKKILIPKILFSIINENFFETLIDFYKLHKFMKIFFKNVFIKNENIFINYNRNNFLIVIKQEINKFLKVYKF